MQKNNYRQVALNKDAQSLLQQMCNVLVAKNYSTRTVVNYSREIRFLFAHYNELPPSAIT